MTVEIPLSEIFADADFNCRGSIAPIDVADLAANIREHGLLSPIVVQPYDKNPPYKYRIIAGYRRHRAFQIIGLPTIPATVRTDLSDKEASLLNLYENLKRQDLNILEEAYAVQKLQTRGMTYEEIAKNVDMSIGWVQIRAALLKLPVEIQQEAAAGVLNQNHIKDLASLDNRELQYEAVRTLKDARARGEKIIIKKPVKRDTLNKKQKKNPQQMMELMNLILDALEEGCFGTRVLAWSMGEITDYDIYQDLENEAKARGKSWTVPREVHLKARGIL